MLYAIPKEHIQKIDVSNIKHVVGFFYKDYPDVIEYYYDVIDNLDDRPDLLERVIWEIAWIIEETDAHKENLQSFEADLVKFIRKNFEDSNKVINSMATKMAIENREKIEKAANVQNADELFDSIL